MWCNSKTRLLLAFLVTVVLPCAGCGKSGLERTVVSGTVTFDDQPIANGEVRFYPMPGTPGPVSGGPIREGKYEAQAKGGVPVGKHRVEIEAFRTAKGYESHPEGGPVDQYLPAKYNEQSMLTAEVTPDTENLDFALRSK